MWPNYARTERAKELARDEVAFQAKAPERLRSLLKGKRLLLLKEMLNDLQYPDTSLLDDILNGFPITGWLPKNNVFPHRVRHRE